MHATPSSHVQAGVSTRQPNGVLGLGLLISLVTISARVVALLCVALAPSDALPSRVVRVTCALCRTFAEQTATSFTWLPLAPVVPAAVHVPAPYMPHGPHAYGAAVCTIVRPLHVFSGRPGVYCVAVAPPRRASTVCDAWLTCVALPLRVLHGRRWLGGSGSHQRRKR